MNEQDLPDDLPDDNEEAALVQEPRLWQGRGWTAKVIKNDDFTGAISRSLTPRSYPAFGS